MARSGDKFLVRESSDVTLDGEIWGLEVEKPDGGTKKYGIAGADGKAEKARKEAETARVAAETKRSEDETARAQAETARAAAEKERAAQQAKNDADQAQNNEAAKGLVYHICKPGEYQLDASGSHNVPTIAGKLGVVYWTPIVAKDHDYNRFEEWAWVDGGWELKGESKHVAPVTTDDIDKIVAGQAVTSTRVVDTTGLSYLWAKLGAWAAAKFSALGHKHPTSDVTGLDAALGDKATKAELKTVQDSLGKHPLAGARYFTMRTTRARITFKSNGGHNSAFIFSSGNGVTWLAAVAMSSNGVSVQKLGDVTFEKTSVDTITMTSNQWAQCVIIPISGTVDIASI